MKIYLKKETNKTIIIGSARTLYSGSDKGLPSGRFTLEVNISFVLWKPAVDKTG